MSTGKKLVILLSMLAVITASVFTLYYRQMMTTPIDLGDEVFKVSKGQTLSAIANNLAEEGIISEPYSMRLHVRLNGTGNRIHEGEYTFPKPLTIAKFVAALSRGKSRVSMKLTILEGWTFQQMREVIAAAPKLKKLTTDWSDEEIMAEVDDAAVHPEGRFYPDTYFYSVGDSDLTIYKKSYALMKEKLRKAWLERKGGIEVMTPYEALIMASIIEKESQVDDELNEISGVFENRLKKGMRLQADPTVIYGIEDYRGNITRKHLKTDTPYNTYTRKGLPPTPISLPGYQAILAAVNPNRTKSIYFVASGGGRHKFSKTLDEHNAAVRKYLLNK